MYDISRKDKIPFKKIRFFYLFTGIICRLKYNKYSFCKFL